MRFVNKTSIFTEVHWILILVFVGVLSGLVGYIWPQKTVCRTEYTVTSEKPVTVDEYLYLNPTTLR